MSINPIDMMRSQEATQIKHVENQRMQYAQDQSENSFQNLIQHEQSKTTQAAKSDNKEYRYDAKEKGNNQYKGSQGKKNRKDQEEKSKSNKQQKSGGFDILI